MSVGVEQLFTQISAWLLEIKIFWWIKFSGHYIPPSNLNSFFTKLRYKIDKMTDDFGIDLEGLEPQIGFLEHQKQVKMKKERLEKEFEKTEDGKFKCPYTDICGHVTKKRQNLRNHIRAIHTGEKPYACDICGQHFVEQKTCKRHMLTHPEMEGVQCDYCRHRVPKSKLETHHEKCYARRKRKRTEVIL